MAEQLQKNDDFAFSFELDLVEKSSDGREGRFIAGFVSTNHLDRQGETLIQEGLDFSPFLTKGFFNDNHDSATDALVGYPTKAELRTLPGDGMHKGWYVEGELLKGSARADGLWDLAKSLHGTQRKLGFSVQGNITQRDPINPKRIMKAIVSEVAITRCPVNTKTGLNLLAKSLSAGHGNAIGGDKTAGSMAPLRMESLEGVEPGANAPDKKKRKKKKMSKSVALRVLRSIKPNLDESLARVVVDHAARHYGS